MRKINKGPDVDADAVILDLEDSVPVSEKETGRLFVQDSIDSISSENKYVYIRINDPDTGFFEEDIEQVACEELDGFVLPKTESREDVDLLIEKIDEMDLDKDFSIIPLVETGMGVVNLREITSNHENIDAIAFGAVDYTGDLGTEISEDEDELLYARSKISNICSALDIQAIDAPWTKIADKEGLDWESKLAKKFGFDGKQVIHPHHLEVVNEIFSPSDEEIDHSQKVVEAFEEAEEEGLGAASLEGEMIDVASYKKAEEVVAKAKAIGKVEEGD